MEWLTAVHPTEARREPLVLFADYFSEFPDVIARVVGAHLTPVERSIHPLVRERRRRFAATEPDELSIEAQRMSDPERWIRTVGTGQDEEVEELGLESEVRHDAETQRVQPAQPHAAPAQTQHRKRPYFHEKKGTPLSTSTDSHVQNLHRKYLEAIDAGHLDTEAEADLLAEFQQGTHSRFVRGLLPVSYACDYDERWDMHEQDMDHERMREEAWFDDE